MSIFAPIFTIGRAVNTISTAYVCGQAGWWAFKEARKMQKEKIRSSDLKKKFIEQYKQSHDTDPDEATINAAMFAYDCVERPMQHRLSEIFNSATGKIYSCIEGKWLEKQFKEDKSNRDSKCPDKQ